MTGIVDYTNYDDMKYAVSLYYRTVYNYAGICFPMVSILNMELMTLGI